MGFLDKAKKLAEQAKEMAEEALQEARARTGTSGEGGGGGSWSSSSSSVAADPRLGTPYVPGMLGRDGWRERGLTDPAAVLPIADRDRAGVPHTTKSEIREEPFGMGRRWTASGRFVGLYYQLYPEHRDWEPPAGRTPLTGIEGWQATLPDGRALAFLGSSMTPVVLETNGLDDSSRSDLIYAVVGQLGG